MILNKSSEREKPRITRITRIRAIRAIGGYYSRRLGVRRQSMKRRMVVAISVLGCVLLLAQVASAAEVSGNYIAQVNRGTAAPQYAWVSLKADGNKLTGVWGDYVVDGTVTGTRVQIRLAEKAGKPAGELSGAASGAD